MKTTRSMRSASMMSFAVLLAVATGGCGSDGPKTQLVAVAPIEAGATCQRGGITVTSGTDENRDGVLDAEEVVNTQTVCNGPAADPASVVNTTILAEGSEECPLGGSLVSSGLDNGDGGGTAGNSMLEAGEVDATTAICTGEPVGNYDLTPPAGAAGTSAITLNGGNATSAGTGGASGPLVLGDLVGATPNSIAIFSTGTVDTTHTVPTITPDLGAVPFTLAANTTVVTAPAPAACANNVVYIDDTVVPNRLVRCTVATNNFYTAITGLSVPAGFTLTFGVGVNVVFPEDVSIAGTVTSLPDGANTRPNVAIGARNMLIAQTGVLALQAATGGAGGQGGTLSLGAGGTLVNLGALNTHGAVHGAVVSPGRAVSLTADILHNAGAINASGGSLATTNGAAGGAVTLTGTNALTNVGAINTSGGSGNAGGAGGAVSITLLNGHRVGPVGRLVNTGAITTSGGTCDANAAAAGAGGGVTITATNGRIRHSSAVTTSGGGSDVPATTCTGGAGGNFTVLATASDAAWDADSMADIGGNITLTGGSSGSTAGAGGALMVTSRRPRGALSRMFGYATLSLAGGNGAGLGGGGGAGGAVVHVTNLGTSLGLYPVFIPEQIHVHPLITATGGAGAGFGGGGAGGVITLQHNTAGHSQLTGASDEPGLLLAGGVNLTPGGGFGAGAAGSLTSTSFGDVVISGPITANATAGFGGLAGGTVTINTTGNIVVSGAVSLNGTGGFAQGGKGGSLSLLGAHVTLSGAVSAVGGGGTSSRPGDGGSVEVQSIDMPSTVTGTINVAAGVSTVPDGLNSAALQGSIIIDGVGI